MKQKERERAHELVVALEAKGDRKAARFVVRKIWDSVRAEHGQ